MIVLIANHDLYTFAVRLTLYNVINIKKKKISQTHTHRHISIKNHNENKLLDNIVVMLSAYP